jgi:myosin heavy subunit
MEVAANVWVKHTAEDVWVRAEVVSFGKSGKTDRVLGPETTFLLDLQDESGINTQERIEVSTYPVEKSESEFDRVKLRNALDDGKGDDVTDLTILPHLHEPAIVRALYARFGLGLIYTSTGPILIAVNPFQQLSIYADEVAAMYRSVGQGKNLRKDVELAPPHVFQIADNAYRNMVNKLNSHDNSGVNQSILVSGESGAGDIIFLSSAFCGIRVCWRSQCFAEPGAESS